jgi:hypothetical protein
VESNSKHRQAEKDSAATVRVVAVEAHESAEVFNLTVQGTHEYFANGILVHNCDAMNLAYLEGYDIGTAKFVEDKNVRPDPWGGGQGRRKIFGV